MDTGHPGRVAALHLAELFDATRNGWQEAAWELVGRVTPYLRFRIRRQLQREGPLESQLRREFDSDDFHQAVWASILEHPSRIGEFQSPEELIAFLAKVIRSQMIDARRRATAAKRDVRREEAIDELPPEATARLVAPGPSPCEQAAADELRERLSHDPSLLVRQVAALLYAGKPADAIAKELKLSVRLVWRVIDVIRRRYGC